MAPAPRQGPDDTQRARLTPRAPDTPASDDRADTGQTDAGTGGGNLVGSREPASAASDGGRAGPIGSELANAQGRNPEVPGAAAGAGNNPRSGSHSLGATTGGERASAGRADANRSSRDDGNSREG
jgi:hypothetical protein